MSNTALQELIKQFNQIKQKLEIDVEQKRQNFSYTLRKNRVMFEKTLHRAHRQLKKGALSYLFNANPAYVITAPIIYAMILPLIVLDIFASIYQFVCFPIYKIKKIKRSDYVAVDRHKLGYLNIFEKINCVYCGYANGLLRYVGEITSLTEQYWCPIKHARRVKNPHERYWAFNDYGDAQGYLIDLKKHREQLKP